MPCLQFPSHMQLQLSNGAESPRTVYSTPNSSATKNIFKYAAIFVIGKISLKIGAASIDRISVEITISKQLHYGIGEFRRRIGNDTAIFSFIREAVNAKNRVMQRQTYGLYDQEFFALKVKSLHECTARLVRSR